MSEENEQSAVFEPSEDLGSNYFEMIRTFEEKYDRMTHRRFHKVLEAYVKKMWYNVDQDELISGMEFDWLVSQGRVRFYSNNPFHRVFGDVQNYAKEIGPELIRYSDDLRVLGVQVVTLLDTGSDSIPLFVKALSEENPISADLVYNLEYAHRNMKVHYKNPDLWDSLIAAEQKRQGLPVLKPVSGDLETIYLGLRRETGPIVVKEHISKQTNPEGRAITIVSLYDLVDEDEVSLLFENEEMYRFRIFRDKDGVRLARPKYE